MRRQNDCLTESRAQIAWKLATVITDMRFHIHGNYRHGHYDWQADNDSSACIDKENNSRIVKDIF